MSDLRTYYQQGRDGLVPAYSVRDTTRATRIGVNQPPPFNANHVDTAAPVRKRRDYLKQQLETVTGYDKRTGAAVFAENSGPRRDAYQRELEQIEGMTLPFHEAKDAEARAYMQANPGPGSEQDLRAQLERQQQVRARAEDIAAEREAQTIAERIK